MNVRDQLTNVVSIILDVDDLKARYLHREPIALGNYSYSGVRMIVGQDVFHSIRAMEYSYSDCRKTLIAVPLPLGGILSGRLPSTTGLFST